MQREVPIFIVDLTQALSIEDEIMRTRMALIKQKLSLGNLLFRGFDGARIPIVQEQGTDTPHQNFIYAVDYRHFRTGLQQDEHVHPIEYAGEYRLPAISLYDKSLMRQEFEYEHWFTGHPLEAIRGIVRLQYPGRPVNR